jgi:hypothetical protein
VDIVEHIFGVDRCLEEFILVALIILVHLEPNLEICSDFCKNFEYFQGQIQFYAAVIILISASCVNDVLVVSDSKSRKFESRFLKVESKVKKTAVVDAIFFTTLIMRLNRRVLVHSMVDH